MAGGGKDGDGRGVSHSPDPLLRPSGVWAWSAFWGSLWNGVEELSGAGTTVGLCAVT